MKKRNQDFAFSSLRSHFFACLRTFLGAVPPKLTRLFTDRSTDSTLNTSSPIRGSISRMADSGSRCSATPATDLADWLVRTLKIPFREAHHITGRIVAKASAAGVALHRLPLSVMREIEPRIGDDVFSVLSVDRSVKSRVSFGGTAPKNVKAQAKKWLKKLEKEKA